MCSDFTDYRQGIIMTDMLKDKVRGSLMAGAAGDALGYKVEFWSRKAILKQYGERGIVKFELDKGCYLEEGTGKALISDDTQMTLFTANGLLNAASSRETPKYAIAKAYIEWLLTQDYTRKKMVKSCWISGDERLYDRRAPGNTCLSALDSIIRGRDSSNSSKGCGGIMRVAPVGLYGAVGNRMTALEVAQLAGDAAEITHQHPLGFLPASLLAALVYKVVPQTPQYVQENMDTIVEEVLALLDEVYKGEYEASKNDLRQMSLKAIALAHSNTPDEEAILQLGEGWTAEEAWTISLFCAIRHITSVEDAVAAAVNHDGDSDSTGSITGNIMGAIYGYGHLKECNLFTPDGHLFEETLELSDLILAIADDLSTVGALDKKRYKF